MNCITLEDARYTVYGDEREMIVTYVSTCGLQSQSNKGKLSSNVASKSPSLYIEHTKSYDKTILTRTFSISF